MFFDKLYWFSSRENQNILYSIIYYILKLIVVLVPIDKK